MKTSLITLLVCLSLVAKGQKTEKILLVKNYFECYFCKRHYVVPDYVPDITKIKNDEIRDEMNRRLMFVGLLIKSEIDGVRNSSCNSSQSRTGEHEWRVIESKSLKKYATAKLKSDGSVDVTGW